MNVADYIACHTLRQDRVDKGRFGTDSVIRPEDNVPDDSTMQHLAGFEICNHFVDESWADGPIGSQTGAGIILGYIGTTLSNSFADPINSALLFTDINGFLELNTTNKLLSCIQLCFGECVLWVNRA